MVVITGQVPAQRIGSDAFQEVDIVGITRSCCKHNYLADDVKELSKVIREAFHIAKTGRPGPVLINLPRDVTAAEADFIWPENIFIRGYNPTYDGNKWMIDKAAHAIAKAKRPVIIAGGGCISSEASVELKEFVQHTKIPVTMRLLWGSEAFPALTPFPWACSVYTDRITLIRPCKSPTF